MMKKFLVPIVSVAGIFLAPQIAVAIDAQVSLGAPPAFYTDAVAGTVPLPASLPAAARNHILNSIPPKCGAPPNNGHVSGLVLYTDIHEKGKVGIPAGDVAVQIVTVNGKRWKYNPANERCDIVEPFTTEILEYFDNVPGGPSRDHHITVECLKSRYDVKVSVETAILPLPPGSRPIPGWSAGFPFTTAAQRAAIRAQIKANTTAKWGYRYAYDGCHTPPMTPSRTKHYLRYRLDYPGGPSGAIVQTGN